MKLEIGKSGLTFILALVVLGGVYSSPAAAAEYMLGPEDVIAVNVWGHPDLQLQEATILPDGSISFPLVGKVVVAGKTVPETERLLEKELSYQLVDPRVTVTVLAPRKIRITVNGQVRNAGIYELQPGSLAADAVAMAGGPTQRAELGKVVVSSRESGMKTTVNLGRRYHFHNKPVDDVELADGDSVFVPETKVPDSEKVYRYLTIISLLIGFMNL